MNTRGLPPREARLEEPTDLALRMLWVTAAMGLSAGAVLVLAALRTKLVAVELGPTGVGSLALLVSFIGFASLVAELGIGNSAVREIAAPQGRDSDGERDAVRFALRVSAGVLSIVGAGVVAVAAGPIARDVLHGPNLIDETRVSAVALAAGVVGAAAMAELRGFRQVRMLALLPPLAALVSTLATLVAWATSINLLSVVIVAPPVCIAAFGLASLKRLPPLPKRLPLAVVAAGARRLITLGLAFVLNAGIAALGALLLRLLINRRLGTSDTGEFQAAFAVASAAVSFLFAALATDYMPLLSRTADDARSLNRAANTQLLVAVLVAAPGVTVLIAGAPAVVAVLYSSAFHDTAKLLRIMLLGDFLRLAAWTVGYILIARRARRLFVATELLYNTLLVLATALLIPGLGLEATAVAYVLAQVASLAWTLVFAHSTSGFRLSLTNVRYLVGLGSALVVVFLCAISGGFLQILSWATVAACTYVALRRLGVMAGVSVAGLRRLGFRGAIAAARRGP
jgi:antigen flippase